MEPNDIKNDLILAKKAAIDSGKFLLREKEKVNQRTNSDSKDIKLRADVESENIIKSINNQRPKFLVKKIKLMLSWAELVVMKNNKLPTKNIFLKDLTQIIKNEKLTF